MAKRSATASPGTAKAAGSVQTSYVDLREIKQDVLCLAIPGHPEMRDHVAVLETDGINYFLKSEEEQELTDDLYGHMLTGLSHDLQIVIRVLPLDLSSDLAYLTSDDEPRAAQGYPLLSEEARAPGPDVWGELALSQAEFLQSLAARRTMLERHFYIAIPADSANPTSPQAGQSLLSLFVAGARGKAASRTRAQNFQRARQQLDLRVGEMQRQLANLGLYAQRLAGNDLARLDYSCLTTLRAIEQPLHDSLIEAVRRPYAAGSRAPRTPPALGRIVPGDQAAILAELEGANTRKGRRAAGKKGALPPEASLSFAHLADLIAPASIRHEPDYLVVESEYSKTLVVRQLPRYVSLAWMKPLLELDEPMTISLHIRPRSSAAVIRHLRRRQLEYASSAQLAIGKGNLVDPEVQVAHGDVADLIARLASGEERMLDFSLYIQLRGGSKRELREREDRVGSVLHNMLLLARPANYEQDKAYRSCMPHARNELGAGMLLPAGAVKHAFPFHSNSLFMERGIIEGITPGGEPVKLDWWSPTQRNANRLIVAPSGAGKSFKTKLDLMRMFLMYAKGMRRAGGPLTFQAIVIDPESEYKRLCAKLGGQWIRLAPGSSHHINPFDLPRAEEAWQGRRDPSGMDETSHGDRLADKIQQLHALMDILLSDRTPNGAGTLTSAEKGLLDRAIYLAYREKGITSDPATHIRPAPLMRDLYRILESGVCGPDPTGLTQRLHRYVHGSLSGIFDGPTNVALNNAVVVFDVHDMDSKELRAVGFFLISTFVWTSSFGSSIPRQLVVDEMLSLYEYAEGARFLETMFARSRKHYLGVTGITQHVGILANSSIPSNCDVKVLMAQEPASLGLVADIFRLTPREVQVLKTCGKGDALLLTGEKRIFVHFEASEKERVLATTDPRQLADMREQERRAAPAPAQPRSSSPGRDQRVRSIPGLVALSVSGPPGEERSDGSVWPGTLHHTNGASGPYPERGSVQ
jgi:hypothetical protein